ncbi:MAG: oligosaccharide flippase family protein, partial [Saprospiraceae bacterium]|nr:oligosaccharide flippase family protein [Saprospiraceae bacterium]
MNRSKSVILLTLGRGVNALVNILFLPYMARALDYAEYATYGQVLLIVELAVILISVSSNQYLYVLLSNSKDYNKKDVIFNSVLLSIGLSFILVVFLFFGTSYISTGFDNKEIEGNLLIYSFCALPMLLSSTFNYVLFFFNRVKHALLIQLCFNIFKVMAIICAVQFFNSLDLIFWFLLVIHFAVLVIYIKGFPVKFLSGKFNKPIMSQFLRYGYTLGMTMVLGTLIKRTDGLMVSVMLDPEDYAIYRMGAIEIPFLMMVF